MLAGNRKLGGVGKGGRAQSQLGGQPGMVERFHFFSVFLYDLVRIIL